MFDNLTGTSLDRRSFLRGSADVCRRHRRGGHCRRSRSSSRSSRSPKKTRRRRKSPKDPFADGDKKDGEKKLVDAEGREYRVCPQCAYNMYKQGRMWVCENCGYSYVE